MRREFLGWSSGTIATKFCVYTAVALLLCVTSAQAQLTNLQVHDDNNDGAGDPGLSEPASFTNPEAGKYIVKAAGRDYWGTSDDGVFVYNPTAVSGEFTAVVRQVGIGNPSTNDWGRSGIMARTDAVAADSAYVFATRRTGNSNTVLTGRYTTGGVTGGQVFIGPNLPESTPFWLSLSRTNNPDPTLSLFPTFTAAYAEDIGGAPGPWQNIANRIVGSDLGGDLFLGLASQAQQAPRVSTFTYENWSVGGLDPVLAATSFASAFAFPVPPDAGTPGAGTMAITEVWNNGFINNQNEAGASLTSGTGVRRTYNAPVLNILDSGGNGHFGRDANLRVVDDGLIAKGAVDHLALYATGIINIPAGEGGDYSFIVNSDDGFRLQFPGKDFALTGGAGELAATTGGLSLQFFGARAALDTVGVVNLPAGNHPFQMTMAEGLFGAAWELLAAKGAKSEFDSDFQLVGALPARNVRLGVTSDGWLVEGDPSGGAQINNIGDGEAAINADSSAFDFAANSINYNDPEAGDLGRILGDVPFPSNTSGADDDFAIRVSATLVVPVDGTYEIGFQGDDGGYVRVVGQTFTGLTENATGLSVIDEGDQRIICDCLDGNTSTVGTIELLAGEYQIEGFMFERDQGAYFEIFGGAVDGPLTLISANGAVDLGMTSGMRLVVPEPSSLILALLGLVGCVGSLRRRRRAA